jgi:hypothetical protein
MTPIELLKEIEAWLCFNTTPNAANTTALRESIKQCLEKHEPKPINYDIEVWAFAERDTVTGVIEFNVAPGTLQMVDVQMNSGFVLCAETIEQVADAISELRPSNPDRYYSIKLKYRSSTHSIWEPTEEWWERVEMKLMPGTCYHCGKEVDEPDYQAAIDYGQTPFCSQYCFEIDNGTPMPVSQGALTFDRIFNQNEIK